MINCRERYKELIEQCRMMHSSIGTGSLPHTVGSKVMDVRLMSKDSFRKDVSLGDQEVKATIESSSSMLKDESFGALDASDNERGSSSDSTNFGSAREHPDDTNFDSFHSMSSTYLDSSIGSDVEREDNGALYFGENNADFPDIFEEREKMEAGFTGLDSVSHRQSMMKSLDCNKYDKEGSILQADTIHSLETDCINSSLNAELAEQEHRRKSKEAVEFGHEKFTMVQGQFSRESESEGQLDKDGSTKIADSPKPVEKPQDRVADWLWALHRIVIDVVRTDRHLEFYGNARNMARMSDILAVYAWIDPSTGYCQGMSDLLSPFIVLYEDDADAFWCFESLLRRVRHNFQMEGPIGVMKQLEALGKILQLTDPKIFTHVVLIGAESLQFAFRMLLVLFRRELSFDDALCMWEMMWAADFDPAMAWVLENSCPESLVIYPPRTSRGEICAECEEVTQHARVSTENSGELDTDNFLSGSYKVQSISISPLCGLRVGTFWPKNSQQRIRTISSLLERNGDDELSVFCVAAILVLNRLKFIKEIHSMDDAIKMFNDTNLEIKVKQCIRMAIKLRKVYFRKLAKQAEIGV
eukprot:Gb_35832 [translate_table: standard]